MFSWKNDVLFVCVVVDYLLWSVTSADDVDVIAASYVTLCMYFIVALMVMPSSLFSFNLFHSPFCVRLQGMFPSGFGNGWLCVSWNIFFLPTVVSTEGRGELRIT